MDQQQIVARLLEKANKYREFTRWVGDRETVQRILALAEELKQRARAMVKPNEEHIRKRAKEIWEQAGKPEGRDSSSGTKPRKSCRRRVRNPPLCELPTTFSPIERMTRLKGTSRRAGTRALGRLGSNYFCV